MLGGKSLKLLQSREGGDTLSHGDRIGTSDAAKVNRLPQRSSLQEGYSHPSGEGVTGTWSIHNFHWNSWHAV